MGQRERTSCHSCFLGRILRQPGLGQRLQGRGKEGWGSGGPGTAVSPFYRLVESLGSGPVAGASLTRFWFSCSSWRKDCPAGPRGTLWSWEGAALSEVGVPAPGGHGQGLGPEPEAPRCLGAPCSLPECRDQPHPGPASICPCLTPTGSLCLCRCISPSSFAIKLPGTSVPTLGPPPPGPEAGKALADSTE